MTRLFSCRSKGLVPLALVLALVSSTTAPAAAPGCKDGRQSAFLTNNPMLPCTFGVGDPTNPADPQHASDPLEVPTLPSIPLHPFNGEHTSILFLTSADPDGAGVQNSSGLDCGTNKDMPCKPESTNDTPIGMKTADVTTPTVSTVSGQPEITAVRVTLINPAVTGTGTLTWSATVNPDNLGTLTSGTLDQNTTFHDFALAQPATSVAGGYSFTIGCGGTCTAGVNDASVFGVKINFTLPEPSPFGAEATALGLLAALARRRHRLRLRGMQN